ncbi:neuronal acetylcholine receptor subunit alpha-3-like [Anopheles nili]|uniref:neuronal acetylcholine receptor subunit alpha-3-like n=1 Tax=Anopheles nili TaxID=185578 RepID=UPI00237BA13A|nr:neuronal acetylcholine receptor subunit alpha-3-like [Anopheles nili]
MRSKVVPILGVILLVLATECHADTTYNVSFDELHKCKQYNAIAGYNYRNFFKLHELKHHSSDDTDLIVDLLVYVLAPRDGHILFSEQNKSSSSALEIVLGGGGNTFSQIRFGQKGAPLKTKSSVGLLSPIDPLPVRVRVESSGQISVFAGNLTGEPFMATMMPKINVTDLNHVSFTTWGTALAKWFYDCPLPSNGTSENLEIDGNELEQVYDDNDLLRKRILSTPRWIDPPMNFTGVYIVLLRVKEIAYDQTTNMFEMTGMMRFRWNDTRYSWNRSEYNTSVIYDECSNIWTPDFESVSLYSGAYSECYIHHNGTVNAKIGEYSWISICMLPDSYKWPYDNNTCVLRLTAAGYERNVPIRLLNTVIQFESYFERSEWSLGQMTKHEYNITSTPFGQLPVFDLQLAMDRKSDIHAVSIYPPYFVGNLLISISFLANGRSRLLLNSLGLIVLLQSFLSLSAIVPRSGVPKIYHFLVYSLVFYSLSSILYVIDLWLKRTRALIRPDSWIARVINVPALRIIFAMDQRSNYNTLEYKNVRWDEVTCILNRMMMVAVMVVFAVGFTKP